MTILWDRQITNWRWISIRDLAEMNEWVKQFNKYRWIETGAKTPKTNLQVNSKKMGFTKDEWKKWKFVKILGLKKEDKYPYFEVSWEQIEENKFSWRLISIKADTYEYEGKEKDVIKMKFKDWEDIYILWIGFNQFWKTIVSSLASQEAVWEVGLTVYLNKAWYKSIFVTNNWEKAEWKYSIDEVKKMVTPIKNAKWETIANDDTLYIEALKKDIEEINKRIWWEQEKIEEEEESKIPESEESFTDFKDKVKEKMDDESLPF